MITHKQLSLADIFTDCQNKFPNNFLIHHSVSSFMFYLQFDTHGLSKNQQPFAKMSAVNCTTG